jgi:molecular chaperone DnaK (HSP70)
MLSGLWGSIQTEGKAMSVIVKRNTPLPCSKKGMYTTVEDFQTSIGALTLCAA